MDIIQKIFEAGVVGCGGAGFPTHVKLNTKVDTFIINGVECEPLLRTDRFIMLHRTADLLKAIKLVAEHIEAKRIVIALKKSYHKEAETLQKAINAEAMKIELFLMDNFYPAGDEQTIVCEVTGRIVPPGGIPLAVGIVVSNVGTMVCVSDALEDCSFTHKYVTVTGEVAAPVIAHVPVGTPIAECVGLAGAAGDYSIILGGPLMGKVISREQTKTVPITKTSSGIIVLKSNAYLVNQAEISVPQMVNRARAACIQCSFCTQLCPRYLLGHPLQPHRIMRKLAYNGLCSEIIDDDDVKQALICCECGICTQFACPMLLQPARVNSLLKKEYASAGIRYEKKEENPEVRPDREYRKVPSKRLAARVGVMRYYDHDVGKLVEHTPKRTILPLTQHIGVPSEPIVALNEQVSCGQIVAKCPSEKLGANIHSGIDGYVSAITDNCIIIEG